jgi:hypothetical protein
MYKAEVPVCSEIHTKHSTQSELHVEFLNVKSGGTEKKPLNFKRLNFSTPCIISNVNITGPKKR